MNGIDYGIVILYFAVVIGLGFWYRRAASNSLNDYFLGGNRMHWLALSMSGSVSTFDITGTMWIVSLLFIMGMKSMWIHWMWGFTLGAFCLAFMGKWVRRSNTMTGAEWMVTRFGAGPGGTAARTAYALMAVFTQACMIGYAFQGIGKFASVYIDLPPALCSVLIIGSTTLYVLLGGFYGVVVTDVIQTVILTLAGIAICVIAYASVTPEALHAALPAGWSSPWPVWRIPEFAGTANAEYEWFGPLAIAWVLKGVFLNAGGPAQLYDFQRFLSARNERDAAYIGASWSFFLVIRWGMAMSIVLLALTGMRGITDPEKVMPMVLQEYLPPGLRGLVIAGFLAAFMSTFSSTVNSAASYVVRDFWQAFARPDAGERESIIASYVSTAGIVLTGVLIGLQTSSIAQIFNWIMMALGSAVVIPNLLRWYWWRLNGWGYAAGTAAGMLLSLGTLFADGAPMYVVFPVISLGSLAAAVLVSLWTKPVDDGTLKIFYESVRPFGAWKPVRVRSGAPAPSDFPPADRPWRAVLNTALGIPAVLGLYLFPMYLAGHWHGHALACLGVALGAGVPLYFTWYRAERAA